MLLVVIYFSICALVILPGLAVYVYEQLRQPY